MAKVRVFCFFLLLLSAFELSAQVNLQTGSAVFSLPMFSWQESKSRLYNGVTLSYNSGNGVKANDIASNVGQNWSLLAGGCITRLQIGEPDDQQAYSGGEDKNQYPAGYMYATKSAQTGCPRALTKYPIYNPMNQLYAQHNITAEDREMDRFAFQFNGKAGMFVLDVKAKQGQTVCAALGDTKMKITFTVDNNLKNTEHTRTTITSFTIQDVDGLIYKFSQHALTKVLKTEYCDANLIQALSQPTFKGGNVYYQGSFDNVTTNPYIIDGWYLTEIKDPLTSRTITFNYVIRTLDNTGGADITYNKDKDYSIITFKRSITTLPELSSIVFPDSHSVTFNYGAERADFKGDYILSSVDIKYGSRSLSQYKLNTTYFILNRYGQPVSDYQKSAARLCLKSVKKIGIDLKDDSPPYNFDYYTGSSGTDEMVPPPFSYVKDIWGYYNGSSSIASDNTTPIPLTGKITQLTNSQLKGLVFLRDNSGSTISLNPKSGFAQFGLLRQIIYPTGGTLSYQYLQNVGSFGSGDVSIGGVHVSQTSSTDGGYSNGCSNPIVTNYSYVNSNGTSSLWGLEMPVNSMGMGSHWEPESRGWHMGLNCLTGCCYWEYQYPGILSRSGAISLTGFQEFMNTMAPVLGILSVISTVVDIVNICLDQGPLAIIAIVLDVIAGVLQYIFTCRSNAKDDFSTVFYNSDLNSVSPLPAQFKRVEVSEGGGTSGKTVSEFTSSDDHNIWYPTNPLFTPKQRFAPWAYGLLKKNTVFDNNGKKVKEIENIYNFNNAQKFVDQDVKLAWPYPGTENNDPLMSDLIGCKCLVKQTTSQRSDDWTTPAKYNNDVYSTTSDAAMGVELYSAYTGRVELITSYERSYKSGDDQTYAQTETDYAYNDGGETSGLPASNYEVNQILVKKSNGDISLKNITYNCNYNSAPLSTLSNNNIFSVPISTTERVQKASGTWENVGNAISEYIQTSSGNIKPYRLLQQRFTDPSVNITYYGGPGSNISAYAITQVNTYGATDNLIGVQDEGNRTVTNIYGYADKYVVASVINADAIADKCAYSSFETSGDFGIWSLQGTPVYSNVKYVTGNSALSLSSGQQLSAFINTSKKYILSMWATAPLTIASNNATLTKSGPIINGLTYYEYLVLPTTNAVTMYGTAIIDELRLYPQNARLRTVTYDPVIGKTSDCDENNRITYYEYDNLGRMRLEKDETGNIIKMHEYNNVSGNKQNGCPGMYYNKAIAETFVKSNCSTGYAGKNISYTIPANKYSSPLGQWYADMLAQQELLVYGQVNADNTSSANGCAVIWYNDPKSQTFTTNDGACSIGYRGGSVTYSVPANKYSSLVSKEVANQMALDEIAANGQVNANDSAHKVCTPNTTAEWVWKDGESAYCYTVNGQLPAHRFGWARDINPNSSTYNQRQWLDMGVQDECPSNTYFSIGINDDYYSQNCGGNVALPYYVSILPGQFSSTISQADANNQVIAYAQSQANQYGGCTTPSPIQIYYNYSGSNYYTVELHNTTTNDYYYFDIQYPGSSVSMGYVLPGTYDVHFSGSFYDPSTFDHLYIAGTSSTWGGSEAYLYGVTIDDSGYDNVLEIH